MEWTAQKWQAEAGRLGDFVEPVVAVLGRSERRVGALRYVSGLLMPGGRKSVEPTALRLGVEVQGLQQFISDSPWDDREVWRMCRQEILPCFGPMRVWIVDETGWVKQGRHSVGVSHQYCGAVGKQANCQVVVELAASDGDIALPLGSQLYLPKEWSEDPKRCARAGVPQGCVFASKIDIATRLIKQTLEDGVAPAPVLGDSVYGDSSEFRRDLRELGLEYCLQVRASNLKGWTEPPRLEKKLKRSYLADDQPAAQTLEEIARQIQDWQVCRWSCADGSPRNTRLAWVRVTLGHDLRKGSDELEQTWLLVDWPKKKKKPDHCFLMHLNREPNRTLCLELARSRWQVEQMFQRIKDDLGFDHFEGRSWAGLHHHLVLASLAYLFVAHCYQRAKKNFWPDVGDGLGLDSALVGESQRLLSLLPT